MIVTLDGQRVSDSCSAGGTLQTLIDEVRATHSSDRLIVAVAINGQRLSEEQLNAGLALSVDGDAQVDLESADGGVLIGNALRSLAQEFSDAVQRLPDIASRLTAGDTTAAVRDVGAFVGLWQTCYRALGQCGELLGTDLTTYAHDGLSIKAHLGQLIEKLTDLRGALESRDVVLLSDLIRYEMPALVESWRALLGDLANQLNPPDRPARNETAKTQRSAKDTEGRG